MKALTRSLTQLSVLLCGLFCAGCNDSTASNEEVTQPQGPPQIESIGTLEQSAPRPAKEE